MDGQLKWKWRLRTDWQTKKDNKRVAERKNSISGLEKVIIEWEIRWGIIRIRRVESWKSIKWDGLVKQIGTKINQTVTFWDTAF
jgi:hypothetical protein